MNIAQLNPDPLKEFLSWYAQAIDSETRPDAMALATVSAQNEPSVRIVLYKGLHHEGWRFFTNLNSQKAQELQHNPQASAVFYWPTLGRQIRLSGRTTRISSEETMAYFKTRSRDSQLGAWSSPQSETIADRRVLETQLAYYKQQFQSDQTIPVPPHWGGFLLLPSRIEFWIEGPHRLHDRFLYEREDQTDQPAMWTRRRLAP